MNILVIILIIGYVCMVSAALFTIIYIIRYHENYVTNLILYLNLITFFNSGIIHSSFFISSIIFFYSEAINLILWKLAFVSQLISLLISTLTFSFIYEYKKIQIIPFLYFIILSGMILGVLISPDSIKIIINPSNLNYGFVADPSNINYNFNLLLRVIISIFMFSEFFYFFYMSIRIFVNARDRKLGRYIILDIFVFFIPLLNLILYIYFQIHIFRELYIILHWFNLVLSYMILIKKPKMFLVLTNKVYFLHIYHKSGILLYSYKFSMSKNETDSTIWGNLLIGLNHILSEFVNKRKNQIDMLQTINSEIIVKYDNEHGFAVLVITNKKNLILENLMEKFLKEFKKRYEIELAEISDINKLITVSEFKDSKKIIEECFQIYL